MNSDEILVLNGITIILKDKLEEMNKEIIFDMNGNVEEQLNNDRDRYIKAIEYHLNSLKKIIDKHSNLKLFGTTGVTNTIEYGENTFF